MGYLVIKQNEHNFRINFIAKDTSGDYLDLRDSTPWFYIGKYTDNTPIYSGQCTLGTYPQSGQCYITLPSSATQTPGAYHGELHVMYSSPSQEIIAQELSVIILPSL